MLTNDEIFKQLKAGGVLLTSPAAVEHITTHKARRSFEKLDAEAIAGLGYLARVAGVLAPEAPKETPKGPKKADEKAVAE